METAEITSRQGNEPQKALNVIRMVAAVLACALVVFSILLLVERAQAFAIAAVACALLVVSLMETKVIRVGRKENRRPIWTHLIFSVPLFLILLALSVFGGKFDPNLFNVLSILNLLALAGTLATGIPMML